MVLIMHGGGTPQNNSQGILVPAYVGKKALNPGRKIECTRARMMRKSPDKQFGIRFLTWNVGSISGKWVKYLRPWKDVVFIFVVCRK